MSLSDPSAPVVLARSEHCLSRSNIHINAIKVLYRLHHAGFLSYLVGGAVRDLLLERQPKDFDIGTDARPQEIRRLFRNSRIIGRRFRLVHIYFRDGIVEVSTFRKSPPEPPSQDSTDDLLITDDNAFGTEDEDAYRRDFTVNALFYNVADYTVIDHVNGIPDLGARVIRTIGDPDVRFCEDPVRMLRACELAGRLDFRIDEATWRAITRNRREIEKASPSRLIDEIGQILRSGSATAILRTARQGGLLEVFLPEAFSILADGDEDRGGFERIPLVLDEMIAESREISDVTLFGALLLPRLLLRRRDIEALNQRSVNRLALRRLTSESMEPFVQRFEISRQRAQSLYDAMTAFQRFGDRWHSASDRIRFVGHPGFGDALALFEILVRATGQGGKKLELWQRIFTKTQAARAGQRPTTAGRRRRRRRRR